MRSLFISRAWNRTEGGEVFVQENDRIVIEAFSRIDGGLVFCSPTGQVREYPFLESCTAKLPRRIRLLPLRPTMGQRIPRRVMYVLTNAFRLVGSINRASRVLVFMPSFLAIASILYAFVRMKKIYVYAGANWSEDIRASSRGVVDQAKALMVQMLQGVVFRLARVRVFNSPNLYEKYADCAGFTEKAAPIVRRLAFEGATGKRTGLHIVCPAAYIPRKNHITLLKAFALVLGKHPQAKLTCIGASDNEGTKESLESYCRASGIAHAVTLGGYVAGKDAMSGVYQSADLLVLASVSEGFPRVAWEAMLHRVPCILPDIENVRAELCHRRVAVLIDPMDPTRMCESICAILDTPSLATVMVRDAYAYAGERLSKGVAAQCLRVWRAMRTRGVERLSRERARATRNA